MPAPELRTERLVLRPWSDADLAPFAALNADPEVMRYFVEPLTREASDGFALRNRERMAIHDYGLWAVEVPGVAPFVGFVGLAMQTFQAPFTPAVEVGWRLAREHWGHGYAPEAATAALDHGFDAANLEQVVSMTTVTNTPSRRVMQKLGMTRDPADDFAHPNVPEGHPHRPHVLYRLSAADWWRRSPSRVS